MKTITIDDEGFRGWLDCLTYQERLVLKSWYASREDKQLSWEDFLQEHYELKGDVWSVGQPFNSGL